MVKTSIVLPCYNEGNRILDTFREVNEFSKANPDYEFIFVNDGSKDNTLEILNKEIAERGNKKIRIISYSENKGKGHAVRTGVFNASGDFICFTDSDLAYSLEHFKEINYRLKRKDIIIGNRGMQKGGSESVPIVRKVIGIGFNILSRLILNLKFKDMQAGIKGFRKEAAKELFRRQKINGFSFDTEVLYLAGKKGYKVDEIPAKVSDNNSYKTSKVNVIRDSVKMFVTLFGIRLNDIRGRYNN